MPRHRVGQAESAERGEEGRKKGRKERRICPGLGDGCKLKRPGCSEVGTVG